jgi:hypothetical protein
MAKWRNGEMAKWRNGEMAKWRNGEMAKWKPKPIGAVMLGLEKEVSIVSRVVSFLNDVVLNQCRKFF